MQRRTLLKRLALAAAAAPLPAGAARAAHTGSRASIPAPATTASPHAPARAPAPALAPPLAPASAPALAPPLDPARWSALNAQRLDAVIAQFGSRGARYDPRRRPYAVFDWDNTCIMNDCEEALLVYLIDQLAFELTPDQFEVVVRADLPGGPFKAPYANRAGQPVRMDELADDIVADYRWLCAARGGGAALPELQRSDQFLDFRAKVYFMYEALCESHPIEVGYTWIITLFAGMTVPRLQALAAASHLRGLGDALRPVRFESPASLPGRAGVLAIGHFQGLRINEEMRALMHTLRANGIDVFVSTASLDDVVRVFAADPNLGFGVAPDNVIGLRLEMSEGRYTRRYRQGWHFNWGPGKTVGIRNVLGGRGEPLMVFGDSDGDASMLREFAGTQVGVIVNRLKKGEIGALSAQAAASRGQPRARYLLQGRNEASGISMPDERSLKYGASEPRLLA
jgi:hypothetical protein